jgi:hypothetical protein
MDGERRDPRVHGANLLAAALAGLGGTLATTPEKVFVIAGMPLLGEQALLFARMLGVRDIVLAYLLLKQPSAQGRRTVLAAIAGMAVVETGIMAATAGRLPLRAVALLTGSTALAGVGAIALATSGEDGPAGGAELLIAGYALAAPCVLELAPIVQQGRLLPFAAYTAGAALSGAGWLFRRNPPVAAINIAASAGGVAAWLLARRRAALAQRAE